MKNEQFRNSKNFFDFEFQLFIVNFSFLIVFIRLI